MRVGDKARPRLMCVQKILIHLTRFQPKTFVPHPLLFAQHVCAHKRHACFLHPRSPAWWQRTRIIRPKAKEPTSPRHDAAGDPVGLLLRTALG